jgi:hypothetical protein
LFRASTLHVFICDIQQNAKRYQQIETGLTGDSNGEGGGIDEDKEVTWVKAKDRMRRMGKWMCRKITMTTATTT